MNTKTTSLKLIQLAISIWSLMAIGIYAKAQTSGTTYIAISNEKKIMTKPCKADGTNATSYLSTQKKTMSSMTKPESGDSIPTRKASGSYQVLTK